MFTLHVCFTHYVMFMFHIYSAHYVTFMFQALKRMRGHVLITYILPNYTSVLQTPVSQLQRILEDTDNISIFVAEKSRPWEKISNS